MHEPTARPPNACETSTTEELHALAQWLREYYQPRFPKEIWHKLTDEVLLKRYFWIKRLDAQKPYREIVVPIPWEEVQRVKTLVERIANDAMTNPMTSTIAAMGRVFPKNTV